MNGSETAKGKGFRGELIAVCSAKGGVGRTVLAVNLAVALSKSNVKIGVLDGSFQFGDVCLALDLHPSFSVKDVVESIEDMDAFGLSGFYMHHPSGVRVLAAPDRPEYADLVTGDIIAKVCDLMLSQHDYVIADTGVGLQDKNLHIVEKADQIFVITNLEMATMKNTKLMLDTLEMLGMQHKVQLIVNRSNMESVIKAHDVADILGVEVGMYIPNQFQIVSQSLNVGIPFVVNQGKSDVAKAMFRMADQLVSRRDISLFKPKAPSLFQSIFSKPKTL
ncbi:AAA family ATPase [Paenibacillus thermotolerans]|uniref:AAA family ATPase n=1 Tax=Paenibacillus thermotolerans TaxID=3027807 RepID=UPI002367B17A|nr:MULTISPECIES: P-loop NTPase [unclassified Paenibacillus]